MIIFQNPGAIDIRALTTFGLSSKAGQDKIGRFGTGLKYATAVILRAGGKMNIKTAEGVYDIGTVSDNFRDREVTQITMNNNPIGFTTELGRDWEIWQAFRELYANALDEGGDVTRAEGEQDLCGDETLISVDLAAFEAIFFSMEEHFIGRDETPVSSSDGLDVYHGRSLFIFYRGIAIMKLKEPAAFRYNLKGLIDLTEDRTAKYGWQVKSRLASAITATDNGTVASSAADQRNLFEATIDFSAASPSKTFLGAAVSLGANCNPTAMVLVRAQLPADGGSTTIVSKSDPGGECLMVALQVLRDSGADLSECKFVLASGVNFYGEYEVRGAAVFLNESIFMKQERMTIAVIEGYADAVGNHWLARQLIKQVESA